MNPVLILCYPYFSIFVATSIELVFVITSRTQYIVYQARPSLARKTEGFLEGGRWSGSRVNHMPGQLHSHVFEGWSSLMDYKYYLIYALPHAYPSFWWMIMCMCEQ